MAQIKIFRKQKLYPKAMKSPVCCKSKIKSYLRFLMEHMASMKGRTMAM